MRLNRIRITNFRNFKDFDVRLGQHAVFLGENRVGKTNLLFALRLILDPTLPDSARKLRLEDFWDGLPRPLSADDAIEISVEFRDFADNANLLAVLADHLVKAEPMVARITYRYQAMPGLERPPRSEADYEFLLYGGDRPENAIGYELRRWMPMDLFPALRDAESDLARWTKSPLRPLLDRAAKSIDEKTLSSIAESVHKATSKIAGLPELAGVVLKVNEQLTEMVGEKHALETAIGFAPTEPERLLRALQLLIDGGKRGVAEASLGSANVLYLALKHLEHQYLVDENERQHTFLAIEEPEAHLHPHLQRMVYRTYLRARDDAKDKAQSRSILLTTHSPNVASVTRLHHVIVLRHVAAEGHTIGRSLRRIKYKKSVREDLERYIDVTRCELFFAKGGILVEGDGEKLLLPALAKVCEDIDLDALGVSICSIGGTNFTPYVRLLGPNGLDIPFVVLTDFDPKGEAVSQEDEDPEKNSSYGESRVVNQIMCEIMSEQDWQATSFREILELAPDSGVFINTFTFEVDLFKEPDAAGHFLTAVKGLTDNNAMHKRFAALADDPKTLDPTQFLKDIDSIGKGRVAQRLAAVLLDAEEDICPTYIRSAFKYLKAKIE